MSEAHQLFHSKIIVLEIKSRRGQIRLTAILRLLVSQHFITIMKCFRFRIYCMLYLEMIINIDHVPVSIVLMWSMVIYILKHRI